VFSCYGTAKEYRVLFQFWKKKLQKHIKFYKLIRQIKLNFVLLSLNGLRNQKRKIEPQTRSQNLAAINNSKFSNSCKSMWTGGSYRCMKLKLMDQRNTNRERIRHIDREYSRAKSNCAVCSTNLMAEEKHELTTSTRPARQIHTFSVSSFLVTTFKRLRMSLKPNVRAWRNLVSTPSEWKIWATNESSSYFQNFHIFQPNHIMSNVVRKISMFTFLSFLPVEFSKHDHFPPYICIYIIYFIHRDNKLR
jgi:hypothetical protein